MYSDMYTRSGYGDELLGKFFMRIAEWKGFILGHKAILLPERQLPNGSHSSVNLSYSANISVISAVRYEVCRYHRPRRQTRAKWPICHELSLSWGQP